jgi:3-dehydroquinate dehydratase-2
MNILVIHGPNLNLLGIRQREIYGEHSLKEIDDRICELGSKLGAKVKTFQSNYEGEIIEAIHRAREWADGLIINPGAYTHYSFAIRDAIEAVGIPTVEVHLSNIYKREDWRRVSVTVGACLGQICGFGYRGYLFALMALREYIQAKK